MCKKEEKYDSLFHCPLCSGEMKVSNSKSLVCSNGHCFDLSRSGYVNLLTHGIKTKYDKDLFKARMAVCLSGFFDPLINQINEQILQETQAINRPIGILDAGCGEGSLLSIIKEKLSSRMEKEILSVGVDLSKEGIALAAKAYPDSIWCVADLAKTPFASHSFPFILNILSPANYTEFQRLLTGDGLVIKVFPERGYLQGIREIFYEDTSRQVYSNHKTVARFRDHFHLQEMVRVQYLVPLSPSLIPSLIQMTPLSWGTSEERLQKVLEKNLAEITVDLTILVGRKT